MSQKEAILNELQPLFDQAKREGLWFFCNYQSLWFSPGELQREQARGSFVWGAVNWQLRDPAERLLELKSRQESAADEITRLEKRIAEGK